ncbi:acyl-CoA dehydrogenase family protein [Actinophytocola oryzae]|uniref:Alkylation response protein AidB-like acyl-CoA dehydrogenase n=1 Tax=Actinophytocola oryzae TaxID=502181 RepID=A0A4R7VQV8_9PSEU|nr:acyl-CoA dehydrogenase family protein [Actinophytocola oryzae]TDV52022.1 alkylation response protein AidB-like acyl-CoA dehydrogenase [Actinophytocola oryzae]
MDFAWSPGQAARHDEILTAAETYFPAEPVPEQGFYSRKDWRRLGELGVLGASVPSEYGGGGLGALDAAHVYEAVGRGCANTGLVFAAAAHLFACAMPIVEFAKPEVRERFLPGMCGGELVAGNAMTEENAGSDVSRLSVTATAVDGGYLLDGVKSFVSNGPEADVYVTYATTDPKAGHLGTTGFVVERDAEGLTAGEPLRKAGLHACPAGTVTFDRCFVPEEQLLGLPGQGSAIFQQSMAWERACLFALYVGVQDRLLDLCVRHARRRRQFGQRIGDFQSVSNRIVEMKLRLESARLLLYRACWEHDRGDHAVLSVALSKLAVSEGVVASALDAVQVFGGRGYLQEDGIEAVLRDALPSRIFSGTSEIQRQLVARELGL